MSGNGLDDRVHNFFAQDNSLQGQHNPQGMEGNWPVPNSNFWVGSHRQDNSLNSSNIAYNSQNSDTDRGAGSHPHHVTQDLNFTQSNLRPDFAKNPFLNGQLNSNGFMYEKQLYQSRENEASFLAGDSNSNQRHFITSKSPSIHDLRESGGLDHLTRASVRQGTSDSPVNFDLFGGQQQRSLTQSNVQPALQRQQSVGNMQQLQQQLMLRKMQELHRQQQLQHLDSRQHNSNNEVAPFAKPTGSIQSSSVYGTPNSNSLQHPWAADGGINWMNRGSPTLQGSSSGHGFPPNLGQTQRLLELVPQQADQSLYGVPISSSQGLPANQYLRMATARSSMPQTPSNQLEGNELNLMADQVGVQNEPPISRQKFHKEDMFGLASGINTGMKIMGGHQQASSLSRNALQQDFLGRQEVAVRPETSREKLSRQVASPQNEVALDPTEEKILFSSDDNIWDAFGTLPHMSGETGDTFDNGGFSNGLPSMQIGSWSALMQSAVAETSSSNAMPSDKWSSLNHHKNDGLPRGQLPSMHNGSCVQQTSSADQNVQIKSALNSEFFPSANAMGLNRYGEKFKNEPDQTLQTEMSERLFQSLEESGKRRNIDLLSERNQKCGDSSPHSLLAEASTETNSPTWMHGQTGTGVQSNGWNPQAVIPPHGDRVAITHEAEKLPQNLQNSEVKMMEEDMIHRSSLWNSKFVPSSAVGFGHVNTRVGSYLENQGILSSKDASVDKSCSAQISDERSSVIQKPYLLDQWNNAHPPIRSHDGRSLGRLIHGANDLDRVLESTNSHYKGEVPRNGMENCDGKENSNDSHHSNLSQRTPGGFRESGLSDASDSQTFPTGKQKSANQLSGKVSASSKFRHHPMNLDEDADGKHTSGMKQSTRVQAMSQQNAHFGLSNIFGQMPKNSTVTEKGQSSELNRDSTHIAKEPSNDNLTGHTPNVPSPFSRIIDARSSGNTSQSSENMLELLHKVDQSRNNGAMMQFKSSKDNSLSRQSEAGYYDGFGHLQHNQSPVSQGFGLQLGPPSQKLRVPDHSVSSQHNQDTFSSSTEAAAAGMRDRGQQMVPSCSVKTSPSAEEARVDFGFSRSTTSGPGSNNSSLYKNPESFVSACHSGTPHSRNIVQNQQITKVSRQMPLSPHTDSFSGNPSHPTQIRSSKTLLPDASCSFQQDSLASSGSMHAQSRADDEQERLQTDSAPSSDSERTSQQFAMTGINLQGKSAQCNMWTNIPKLHNNMGIQFQQESCVPQSPLPNIVESIPASLMQGFVNSQADGEEQRLKECSGQPIAFVNTGTVIRTPCTKRLSDGSPSNSAEQRDVRAIGRSLNSNSFSHQNSLLQSQVELLKDRETDSGDRAAKRMRGPDNIQDVQQGALRARMHNEHNAVVGGSGSLGSSSALQTADCKSLGFSRPLNILQRDVPHKGNMVSNDSLGVNRDVSQSLACSGSTSVRTDHHMGSSWFSQNETSSNGKSLQIYSAHQVTPIKPGETPFAKPSDDLNPELTGTATLSDVCQMTNSYQTSLLVANGVNGHFTSLRSAQLNLTGQPQVVLRQNKAKASPVIHPWHKVISQDSHDLWSLSMAETDWNEAVSRLTEKFEDDAELVEDGPSVLRSKRRLILTTHLMQQLLQPAPANIIRSDASLSYDILVYCISRVALGDACGMASRSSNMDAPSDDMDILLAKGKSLKRNSYLSHGKATEELTERARKLECDLLRLDKSASVSNLRVECQEQEKFSIINRFAKFHGRGQHDNTETTSVDINANIQKSIPQRYVTAFPMPKTLPDWVQCLSL